MREGNEPLSKWKCPFPTFTRLSNLNEKNHIDILCLQTELIIKCFHKQILFLDETWLRCDTMKSEAWKNNHSDFITNLH